MTPDHACAAPSDLRRLASTCHVPRAHQRAAARDPRLPSAHRVRRRGERAGTGVRARRRRPRRVVGGAGGPLAVDAAVAHGAPVRARAAAGRIAAAAGDRLVRGRPAQRGRELRRSARRGGPGRPGRVPLRGRARRPAQRHLRGAAARGVAGGERVGGAGRAPGRPGGRLPAGAARDRDRHARDRPDRRGALPRVRRVLRRSPPLPGGRHRGPARGDDRRAVPEGPCGTGQGRGRRGGRRARSRRARARRPPHGRRRRHGSRPRRVVARRRRHRGRRPSGAVVRRRASPVRDLHLRDDGQAERGRAHLGRLPRAGVVDALGAVRTRSPTTSTGARPISPG